MNRWWGSKADSAKQSSERDQRAARRTVNNLDLHLSEDENDFEDCNTSFRNTSIFSLDGADDADLDLDDSVQSAASVMSTPAEIAAQRALPFEDQDFDDDAEAWKKELKLKFDPHDVPYWFNSVESTLKKYGINKQWSRKDAIVPLLPDEVVEECKPILRLPEAEAGRVYKALKQEIIQLYGPKEEDAFKKAMALRLTTTPSALGKKLIHVICPGTNPFDGCHCARMVFGFWDAQMTPEIKSHLAGLKFNKDTYKDILKKADEVFHANGGISRLPGVVAATTTATPTSPPTQTTPQVSAVRGGRGGRGNRGGGRGGRGGRGGGNNSTPAPANNSNQKNQNSQSSNNKNYQPKPHQRGPRHSPDVPDNACSRHWQDGRNAKYCSDPLNCDWVKIIAPRS